MAESGLQASVKSEPTTEVPSCSLDFEKEARKSSTSCTTNSLIIDERVPHVVIANNQRNFSTFPAFQPQYFTPIQRMDFVPSFCHEPRERRSFSDDNSTEECDDYADGLDKLRSKWTRAQTDTLVTSWKDGFEELENNRNPTAWKIILRDINRKGGKKSMDQLKKKLRNLKDRFKDAKKKSKVNGGPRHFPKYYDIFDELIGAREEAKEQQRKSCGYQIEPQINGACPEPQTEKVDKVPPENGEKSHENPKPLDSNEHILQTRSNPLPRRTKKKKPSKTTAYAQLIDFLGQMQKQQEESMKQFLEGMERIEEKSRKHTEETLLKVAKIFAKRKKRRSKNGEEYESSSEEEIDLNT